MKLHALVVLIAWALRVAAASAELAIGPADLAVLAAPERMWVARNGDAAHLELYRRDAQQWRQIWRSEAWPTITALTAGAVAAGRSVHLLDALAEPPRVELLGEIDGPVRALECVPVAADQAPALLCLAGGHDDGGRWKEARLFLWRADGERVPRLLPNVRARHHAWDLSAGHLDHDGKLDVLVPVWKATYSHPRPDHRPFVFTLSGDDLLPRWLGSSLARPFEEVKLADLNGDGLCELIATERLRDDACRLSVYRANAFGFDFLQSLPLAGKPAQLRAARDGVLLTCTAANGVQRVLAFAWRGPRLAAVWESTPAASARPIGFDGEAIVCALDGKVRVETPPRVTLLAVGDVMLARGVAREITQHGVEYPFAPLAETIRAADVAFCNLESPACDAPAVARKRFVFRAAPAALQGLVFAGFDAVSLANNHRLDCGSLGLRETRAQLETLGLTPLDHDAPGRVIERQGLRIGFVAFTTVGMPLAQAEAAVARRISAARAACDVLIASFHWGREYESRADATQRRLARLAIDHGADLIIGHHPHVVQELEFYRGRPIAYSLGNFVFDQVVWKEREGAILFAELRRGGVSKARLESIVIERGQAAMKPQQTP